MNPSEQDRLTIIRKRAQADSLELTAHRLREEAAELECKLLLLRSSETAQITILSAYPQFRLK